MWDLGVGVLHIFVLASLGGLLGVLFMIPIRRYLIVKEHGKLPYPEGTACAEVLVAGDTGGSKARLLLGGLGLGGLFQFLMHKNGLAMWHGEPYVNIPGYKRAHVSAEVTPELLGVGYIIGPRISAIMLAGGMLGWLVLIPMMALFGEYLPTVIAPSTQLISQMGPYDIWSKYIRYIGAGAVAFGGFITLLRSLPTIFQSFKAGLTGMLSGKVQSKRTNKNIPMLIVLLGAIAIGVGLAYLPIKLPGTTESQTVKFGAIAMVLFAFFFVTVSSRIVGLIGSTSNPVSGMTIATLLVTSIIYVSFNLVEVKDPQNLVAFQRILIISVGAVVCIAACIAGDTSQDLKTGFLVGATPWKQQIGEIVGVLTSAR